MAEPTQRAGGASDRRRIAGAAIIAGALALLALGFFLLNTRYETGYPAFDGEQTKEVRDAIELMLRGYDNLVSLMTASFGAIAFLVTYQQKERAAITARAWALLATGVICLTGLIMSLLGREYVILMVTRNAVEFGIPMLTYGRWASYGSVVLAVTLVSFFAFEVAFTNQPVTLVEPGRTT